MGIEYELKFQAAPEQLSIVRQAFSAPEQVLSMETTYYDTPTGKLAARHYTLRRRLENGCSICTIKAPAELGRGEWETQCDDIWQAVPVLCKLGGPEELPVLLQEGLNPICGARFTRIAKILELPGCTAELALDSGVLFGGGREIPLCEIEVELKTGEPQAVAAFAAQLAVAYGLLPEKRSKFARASALARGE